MKIKYLQTTHDSNAGDEKEVPDFQANILINVGIAEALEEKSTTEITQGNKKDQYVVYTPIDTTGLLLNLNGTPVVNDFGELVEHKKVESEEKQVEPTEKPKAARKPRNTAKTK